MYLCFTSLVYLAELLALLIADLLTKGKKATSDGEKGGWPICVIFIIMLNGFWSKFCGCGQNSWGVVIVPVAILEKLAPMQDSYNIALL